MANFLKGISCLMLIFSFALSVTAAPTQKVKHVILIGMDGWGAYSVPKADMPNLKKLMNDGSYTLKKRTILPSSSAPNWASMFMGAPTEIHGYTTWGSQTPEIPSPVVNEHGIFPTIFSIAHKAHPEAEIGVIYEWEGIKYLVDTLSLSYHAQASAVNGESEPLCSLAETYIKSKKPELFAVCFDEPDHTGHSAGHDTPEYYTMLTRLDSYIGRIVKAVEEAGIKEETVIIVTSDHGGIEKGHGGISLMEMETPFIITGKGIKKNQEITDVMMQYDVTATIASLLGLEQPQAWTGRPTTAAFN